MTKPLVVCLALVISLQASAQPARRSPAELKAELTRSFAKGADVAALDFAGQAEPLVKLFDQAKYVQAGREPGDLAVAALVAGEARLVGAGDGILFPPNVEHAVEILEDYTTINCKDIVPGFSVYHGRWER